MKKKVHIGAILLAWACFLLTACAGPQTGQNHVSETPAASSRMPETRARILSMATNGDWSTSFKGRIMEEELEKLEENSEDALKIKLYDRSRLGDDAHLISGVLAGTIDIIQSSPASQVNVVPEVALLEIPGLFDHLEEWNRFLEGSYRETLNQYYEKEGLKLLNIFAYSWRDVSSRTPVRNPKDLEGLRIRTMKNKYHEAFWNELGAVAVPYDYAELYFCIDEGMADAQENLLDVLLADNLFELQHCVTFTHHLPMISTIAMRKELYDSLSGEEQEWLNQFVDSLKTELIAQMPEEEERLAETLDNDYGLDIMNPSTELEAAIRVAGKKVMALLRTDLGKTRMNQFMDAVAEARKE